MRTHRNNNWFNNFPSSLPCWHSKHCKLKIRISCSFASLFNFRLFQALFFYETKNQEVKKHNNYIWVDSFPSNLAILAMTRFWDRCFWQYVLYLFHFSELSQYNCNFPPPDLRQSSKRQSSLLTIQLEWLVIFNSKLVQRLVGLLYFSANHPIITFWYWVTTPNRTCEQHAKEHESAGCWVQPSTPSWTKRLFAWKSLFLLCIHTMSYTWNSVNIKFLGHWLWIHSKIQ